MGHQIESKNCHSLALDINLKENDNKLGLAKIWGYSWKGMPEYVLGHQVNTTKLKLLDSLLQERYVMLEKDNKSKVLVNH